MTTQVPHLILFDIDGTLLWTRGSGRAATKAAMMDVFGTCGALDSHNFGGKTDWLTLAELLSDYSADDIGKHMPAYEQAMAHHLTKIITEYTTEPCPGALDVVHALRKREDVLIGIVTGNVAMTAPIKLRTAGFDPAWFPVGAYGSEAMDRDHLPAIAIERAAKHVGKPISPEQVTVIGDTPADISCARAAGARAVAVMTGFSKQEELIAAKPDILLDDLTSLLDALGY
jgi:phosphoglycolate phosphatase